MRRLPVRKYVQNYGLSQGSSEAEQILEAVRNYPTYSVDKLQKILPDIKRNKIQKILEKKGLSRIEERLEFSGSRKVKLKDFVKVKRVRLNTEGVKAFFAYFFQALRSLGARLSLKTAIVVFTVFLFFVIFNLAKSLITTQAPIISLEEPAPKAQVQASRVFVRGKVTPVGSRVTVNGKQVALNGDGSFTAISDLLVGENVLEIRANYLFKKAEILRMVVRELTDEERQTKLEEEERRRALSEIEKEATGILAAQATNEDAAIRITTNSLVKEGGYTKVVGEVSNFGETDVSFVQVKAAFISEKGEVLDTKTGLATDFGEVLEPGREAKFETMPTKTDFYHYQLTVEWEEE